MKALLRFTLVAVMLAVIGRASAGEAVPTTLLGEWELVMIARDANVNGKLDPAERETGIAFPREKRDYFKFNADKSCLFYSFKNKGTYELTTRSEATLTLEVKDRDGNRVKRASIVQLTSTELVLFSSGAFSIYKRPRVPAHSLAKARAGWVCLLHVSESTDCEAHGNANTQTTKSRVSPLHVPA